MKRPQLNIIDYLIIVFIFVVVVFSLRKVKTAKPSGKEVNVKFTVELRALHPDFAKNIALGDEIRDAVRGTFYGNVEKIESKDALYISENREEGIFVASTIQEKRDFYITVLCKGIENESSILVNGTQMNVGKLQTIKGKMFAGEGYITDLTVEPRG